MTIKEGNPIPDGTLAEFVQVETESCGLGPNPFKVSEQAKGKTVALFAVPGAFTPTCSEQHLPGYLEAADQLKAKGVDEIWCVAVNDPFVMGAWGKNLGVDGRIRMLADGSGTWTKALGLELDLTDKGLGVRSQRYSALLRDGVVEKLNLENGAGLGVSDAQSLLKQL